MAIIDYEGGIARDTEMIPPNVFYDGLNGGGCQTVMYDSVEQARAVTQNWIDVIDEAPLGSHAGLCAYCACSHSFSSPLYHRLGEYRCRSWKAAVAKGEIDPMMYVTKRAWIRDPNVPAGQPAPGRISCPCGQTPESLYEPGENIHCPCDTVYAWDGTIVQRPLQESIDLAMQAMLQAEDELGPNFAEDGYTEVEATKIVAAVRFAMRFFTTSVVCYMVWDTKDRDGYGGDSDLVAVDFDEQHNILVWSIPIPFASWSEGSGGVVDAIAGIVTGATEPDATVQFMRHNDGYNCTW